MLLTPTFFKIELIIEESETDDLTECETAVELQSDVTDSDIPVPFTGDLAAL